MSMFTLQTLGLILLFGLIGLLVGWLIRSFFCKPSIGGGKANLSGSAKGDTTAKMGSADISGGRSAKSASAASTSASSSSNSTNTTASNSSSGTLNKTATVAAGAAAVAATAAAVASSKKDDAVETVSNVADSATNVAASGAAATKTSSVDVSTDTLTSGAGAATTSSVTTGTVVADSSSSGKNAVDDAAKAYWSNDGSASTNVSGTTGSVSGGADIGSASGSLDTDSVSSAATTTATNLSDTASSTYETQANTTSQAIETATSNTTSSAADSAASGGGISGTAAGVAGAAAVAAAAYSASSSADDSNSANNTQANASAGTTQGASGQQDSPQQLRSEAETLLNNNFEASGSANGANHIIIGAGPAGVVAAETIRKLDKTANITLIGDEPEAPYSRMAIPYFLEENIQAEGTHLRKANNHYEDAGIQVLSGRVKRVDTENKQVETANGLQLPYDKLLIATGSHPLTPPIPGLDNPKVGNCWDLADSRKIIENVKSGSTVVQIGAGFIGCIILESLVKRGAKLTVVEMDNRMVPRMLDDQCGGMLKSWCESKGVTVLTETQVKSIEDNGDKVTVNLSKGEAINADYVISATGVASNTDFLEGSGIKVDQGILVNHNLETNVPGVYAAGDVAQGIDFTTGGYSVHAIQPTAADHGTISAKNMVKGNTTRHKGSLQMNILSTLDLISTSYGAWEGVEGGEHTELVDKDNYKYIRLQFKDDKLVGANTLGITQNIGALRGLIQNKSKLGPWKQRLMDNPLHFMDAYVSLTGNHG